MHRYYIIGTRKAMIVQKYLETLPLFEIERYDVYHDLSEECISFHGSPRKHPYDKEKMILVLDPFSSHTVFYEFFIEDIKGVDAEPSIATENGDNLNMVRIWVKKGSLGLKYEPFEVSSPLKIMKDSEVLRQAFPD